MHTTHTTLKKCISMIIFICGALLLATVVLSCPTDDTSTSTSSDPPSNTNVSPVLSYANITGTINTQVNTTPPTWTDPDISATYTYEITPALPTGLSFAANTGIISGTPTLAHPATLHTITATDDADNTTTYTAETTITIQ